MVVGLSMDGIMRLVERRFSHWATDVSAASI
jgi:ABC-type nitrate/sulfonate/bicarbonate transport system permease component